MPRACVQGKGWMLSKAFQSDLWLQKCKNLAVGEDRFGVFFCFFFFSLLNLVFQDLRLSLYPGDQSKSCLLSLLFSSLCRFP